MHERIVAAQIYNVCVIYFSGIKKKSKRTTNHKLFFVKIFLYQEIYYFIRMITWIRGENAITTLISHLQILAIRLSFFGETLEVSLFREYLYIYVRTIISISGTFRRKLLFSNKHEIFLWNCVFSAIATL